MEINRERISSVNGEDRIGGRVTRNRENWDEKKEFKIGFF